LEVKVFHFEIIKQARNWRFSERFSYLRVSIVKSGGAGSIFFFKKCTAICKLSIPMELLPLEGGGVGGDSI